MKIHEARDHLYRQHPLLLFSSFTDHQYLVIRTLGREILECLSDAKPTGVGDTAISILRGPEYDEAYGKIWLWVVSAHEVIGNMCRHNGCFNPRFRDEVASLEKRLSFIHFRFVNQEFSGTFRMAVGAYLVPEGVGQSPDMVYTIEGHDVSARELITDFEQLLAGIHIDDFTAARQSECKKRLH